MIIENIYAGRNNVFSLQLLRDGSSINLLSITRYELHLSSGRVFDDQSTFFEKDDGVVEINIGSLLLPEDAGTYIAYLVTFDPINLQGVRWPNFKLKVRA